MRRRFFQWLAAFVAQHRRGVAVAVALLFAAALAWLATGHLGINSSRNSIADDDDPEQARLLAYSERFGASVDIVVVLRGDDREALRETANALGERLSKEELLDSVFFRVDLGALAENAMYYLPLRDLAAIRRYLRVAEDLAEDPVGEPETRRIGGVATLVRQLNEQIDALVDGDTAGLSRFKPEEADLDQAVLVVEALADELRAWLEQPDRSGIALRARFSEREVGLGLDDDGYLVADRGHLLLLQIRSRQDLTDDRFAIPVMDAIHAALEDLVPAEVTWGVTGVPALVAEERSALKRDLPMTSVVSIIGCLLLFLVVYRSFGATAVVFLPLGVGLAWALATTALVIGSLNLVTSIFAVILVGMGIDVSVHLFTRIREERKHKYTAPEAVRRGLVGSGPPILTGVLTSAAAFGAMGLTSVKATRELGIVASTGLLLVMAASFLILPLLLGREGSKLAEPRGRSATRRLTWAWPRRYNIPVLLAGIAITVLLGGSISAIEFNFDVATYLPEDSPSLATVEVLEEHGIGGLEYAVLQSPTLEAARAQLAALEALKAERPDLILRAESVFDVLPPDLQAKDAIVGEIRALTAKLPHVQFAPRPDEETSGFGAELTGLGERLRDDLPFTLRTLGEKALAERVAKLAPAIDRLAEAAKALEPDVLRLRLSRFEDTIAGLNDGFTRFFHRAHRPLSPSDLPRTLVSTFYHPGSGARPTATYAIRVFPAGDATDPEFTRPFTAALREIDPEATGYAITYMHFGVLLKEGLVQAGIWASLIVILLVLLDFRRLSDVILALVPLAMGGVWMVGLLNVLGVDYTFANVLSIPLIIGIGIDSGVHVIHRWRECDGDVGTAVWTTGKAILVSSLTTMLAFGSLMLSSNGGGKTLGMTLILGVSSCLVASLVFLPALLDMLPSSRRIKP